jgi:Family of unknown function (DUF6220)
MSTVRPVHLVVAGLFVIGVVVQVFLAGLGVFDGPAQFETHASWGYLLGISSLILLVLAVLGGLGRRQILLASTLLVMFILQSILVALRADMPAVAALHAVNGFGILLVGIVIVRDAWATRGGALTPTAVTEPNRIAG